MMSVRMLTSIPATKGSAELNHRNLNDPTELRLMAECGLKKDESRTNEDVSGSKRLESVGQHQQPQGPMIQWDRFLPLRSLKVLLVEDDDSTRHVVSALLRNCSYEVTAVASGLEAWKLLTDLNKQIDLVLTEVVMPHLSGIGLLSKITNLVPRQNTPVIMMSSDDSMGIVFNCLSKGAVDFLVKPIRKNELKNLWQHVWRKCHSSSESESGVGARTPTKARSIETDDDESEVSDEDDDTSIGLTAKDGSDDGSGTQVVHARAYKISTREHAGEDSKLDTVAMGKDLEIGAFRNLEKTIESNLKETSGSRTKSTSNENIANSKCSPALELSLMRPLAVEDTAGTRMRNVLKQSDLSAFSRYNNTTSNANKAPTTNVGSCSLPAVTISSEAANMTIRSNSNGAPNQRSNGSSTFNNDMGSSTNNHHQHHKIQQQQEMANQDNGSSRTMVSNGLTALAETNYGSSSGSNSKSNGENGNNGHIGVTEKGKFGNLISVVDQDRLAQREAALNKFRQKRKERCFDKKVRYQSRKKLAEQRPRVRGQFVRQGGKDADS